MRRDRIYLAGFMGAGKSTVGRILAARLGWPFVDLDAVIEQGEGRSIAEIFEDEGESYFRRLESEYLRTVSVPSGRVVALGGGTYADPLNRAFIDSHGLSIFLDASLESVLQRVPVDPLRPLFSDPEEVSRLYLERRPSYRMAQMVTETDGLSPEEIADRLVEAIRNS
jgi:shikimate kinase